MQVLLEVEGEGSISDSFEVRSVIREYNNLKKDSGFKHLLESTMRGLKKKFLAQRQINQKQ